MAIKIPHHTSALVKELFTILNESGQQLQKVAKRSGVSSSTINEWRWRRSPKVTNLEAVLNSLGFELHIRRKQ